jgi:hypothetical protein
MKLDNYEYTICHHWVSALVNDDYTGLDDDEEKTLRDWLENNEQRSSHWDVEEGETFFAVDEVSGVYADCVTVRQYFPLRG